MAMSRVAAAATEALCALMLASGASALQLQALQTSRSAQAEGQNVCILGRVAPELFLLGAPGAGSSAFYEEFVRSRAIVQYMPASGEEALHADETWSFAPDKRDVRERVYWLAHYPTCNQEERQVAIDSTPGYFSSANSSMGIFNFYMGSGHTSKLKFLVFLRNPVARSQSHYYHFVENGVFEGAFALCPVQEFPTSFAKAVQRFLAKGDTCGHCGCNGVFDDSMYVTSFKNYFSLFSPSQFTVVPFEEAVKPGIVTFMWDMLDIPRDPRAKQVLASADGRGATKHRAYRSLDEDLSEETKARLVSRMDKQTGAMAVANILVSSGAFLYSFNGSTNDAGAIEGWLSSNWGS